MRENRLRTLWKNDQAAVNGWLAIPNSFSAETMAHQGWDTLTIDLQHGVVDYQAMVTMLQAISTTNTVPVVRVPWLEPGIIMKTLDAGAYGVICPMVSTRERLPEVTSPARPMQTPAATKPHTPPRESVSSAWPRSHAPTHSARTLTRVGDRDSATSRQHTAPAARMLETWFGP